MPQWWALRSVAALARHVSARRVLSVITVAPSQKTVVRHSGLQRVGTIQCVLPTLSLSFPNLFFVTNANDHTASQRNVRTSYQRHPITETRELDPHWNSTAFRLATMNQSTRTTNSRRYMQNNSSGADLVPYIHALTVLALSCLFVFWHRRPLKQRFIDLVICFSCSGLHHAKFQLPLLSLALAISYTLFTCSPGNFASLTLQTYPDFKRGLPIVPTITNDSGEMVEEDCPVCYDSNQIIAQLPCNHRCCISCLDLMAKRLYTMCPQCRTPLFAVYDHWIYVLYKGAMASLGTCLTLCAVVGVHFFRNGAWGNTYALLYLGSVFPMGYFFQWYCDIMRLFGDDWWRGRGNNSGRFSDVVVAACECGAGMWFIGQTVFLESREFR